MFSLRPWMYTVLAGIVGLMTVASTWLLAERGTSPPIVIEGISPDATIVVAVEGAVAAPGVYALPGDARVQQAIAAAGGLTESADSGRLNLAARVRDEDRLVVPARNGAPAADATLVQGDQGAPLQVAAAAGPIDVNAATASELDSLPGIGPVLAGRIVAYREAHGPFRTVEELARVDGISAGMVDDLRDAIVAGP